MLPLIGALSAWCVGGGAVWYAVAVRKSAGNVLEHSKETTPRMNSRLNHRSQKKRKRIQEKKRRLKHLQRSQSPFQVQNVLDAKSQQQGSGIVVEDPRVATVAKCA